MPRAVDELRRAVEARDRQLADEWRDLDLNAEKSAAGEADPSIPAEGYGESAEKSAPAEKDRARERRQLVESLTALVDGPPPPPKSGPTPRRHLRIVADSERRVA